MLAGLTARASLMGLSCAAALLQQRLVLAGLCHAHAHLTGICLAAALLQRRLMLAGV
jgi:hypothetical protein